MATIVHDWLLNRQDFVIMTRLYLLLVQGKNSVPSVFNLTVDTHIMGNWQITKRISADQCHTTVQTGSNVQLIEATIL